MVVAATRVRWIPPLGSFSGKSNVCIFTPFFKPLNPAKVTFLLGSLISLTEIPRAVTEEISSVQKWSHNLLFPKLPVRLSAVISHSKFSSFKSVYKDI